MSTPAVPTMAEPTLFGMSTQQVGQFGLISQVAGFASSAVAGYFQAKQLQIQQQSQASTYDYQSKMSAINARLSEAQAQQIMRAGERQTMVSTMRAGQQMASYRTTLAARGGTAGDGSAQEVMATAMIMKDIDKMTINSNTVRAAESERMKKVGLQNQAALLGVSSSNLSMSADTISPFSAVTTSLLGGAGQVASSWYNMNRSYK
jgi:hypothetical protein